MYLKDHMDFIFEIVFGFQDLNSTNFENIIFMFLVYLKFDF